MIIRTVSLLVVRGRRKSVARTAAESSGARRNVKQTGGGGGPGGGGRRCSSCGRGRGGGGAEAAEEEAEKWRKRRIRRMKLRAEREAADGRCPPKVVEWLRRHTHFDRREIECLWRAHWRLAASEAPPSSSHPSAPPFGTTPLLDRHTFRHLMHTALGITDDAILERLFAAFAGGTGTTGSSSSSGGGGGGGGGGGTEGGGGGGWTNTGDEGTGAAPQGGGGGGGGSQSPPPPTHGPGASGGVDARRWVLSLSVLLRGTQQEKRAFCFHAYDLNGDGVLSRDEVARLLRHSLALGRRRSSSPSSGGGGTATAKVQRGVRKGEGGEGGGDEDRGDEEGGGVKEESSGGGGAGGGGGGGRRGAADDDEEEEGEESVKELAEVALARLDVDGDGRVSAEDFERAVAAEPLLLEALGPCLPEKEAAQAFMEYIVTCAGT